MTGNLLHGLDFEPAFIAFRSIWSGRILGDDAFPVQLCGMLKHLLPIAGQMFGVQHWQLDIVLTDQVGQSQLALDLGQLAEIPVAPEQVKGVIDGAGPAYPPPVQPAVRRSWSGLRA
jgi:hypothetical protein